jgi:hypothetical protein
MLEKPLELDLSGRVHYVRADSTLRNKNQVVTVRLDPNFLIRPNGD